MALQLGDFKEVVPPFREYLNIPIQNQLNQYFKIFQFTPILTVSLNYLNCAMAARTNYVTDTIEAQCREWQGFKVWPVCFVKYESANPLEKHFKSFYAYLPVSHSIFLYNQPEIYADQINPHIASLNCIGERLLKANAKFIRGMFGRACRNPLSKP